MVKRPLKLIILLIQFVKVFTLKGFRGAPNSVNKFKKEYFFSGIWQDDYYFPFRICRLLLSLLGKKVIFF